MSLARQASTRLFKSALTSDWVEAIACLGRCSSDPNGLSSTRSCHITMVVSVFISIETKQLGEM
jgi:hypothetical protein